MDFSLFTRYNSKGIQDRQTDTLIGLAKGLIADGSINQAEVEFLLTWLVQNSSTTENPIIINLLDKVKDILEDGVVDQSEAQELFNILLKISGDKSEIGEICKSTNLPIDEPQPEINFPNNKFLLTGTFVFGTRKKCEERIKDLGGVISKNVTLDLNYLVIGQYVTDSWAHETFGRKIEKAMEYQSKGAPIAIVNEDHWDSEILKK